MKYQQRFGPLKTEDGTVFRLWAPDARTAELRRQEEKPAAMRAEKDGWYEITDPAAKPGDRYQFVINGTLTVPDPASRFQPDGPQGSSEITDTDGFAWTDAGWRGRPWEEAVIYELHTGCFSPSGTYHAIEEKLDHLVSMGVTAIELMPLAEFEGERGWGYDGVLPYAPKSSYGRPEALKKLIDAAHAKGLMVFLDVVYNHFGPAGNYLSAYAASFFTQKHQTPWGAAINYENSRDVRDFFIGNAMYWLQEFHFDGLRFDAVHAIMDGGDKHILEELAETVHAAFPGRFVHLMLENDNNEARHLARSKDGKPAYYDAQWNDDVHHALHVLLTGETAGYYAAYKDDAEARLGRGLAQGFIYQGEPSPNRKGEKRGEPSAHLPPQAFINFLQNHDQIGNRAMGQRLTLLTPEDKLTLGRAILLLGPAVPLLFMGEEWGARTPFLFFCDFDGKLADAVREGRRKEFEGFSEFSSSDARKKIPDPNANTTFVASKLQWDETDTATGREILALTRQMLELRRQHVIPLIKTKFLRSEWQVLEERGLGLYWRFEGGILQCFANFSQAPLTYATPAKGRRIWGAAGETLPAFGCNWFVGEA